MLDGNVEKKLNDSQSIISQIIHFNAKLHKNIKKPKKNKQKTVEPKSKVAVCLKPKLDDLKDVLTPPHN